MKIVVNEKLINRNRKIGQFTTIGSLIILAGGLYLSFQKSAEMINFSFIALILGFVLSQVGIYFGNRWGRHPRPDEVISAGLKGLDDRYTLYHYVSPVPHLLLGPTGIWTLIPYSQKGKITYDKGRWHQKGGNLYLKIFAQEGLGRPDLEVTAQVNDLKKILGKDMPEEQIPPIHPALVFYNEKVEIDAEEAPIPTIPVKKMKDLVRKSAKENAVAPEMIQTVRDVLVKE